MVYLFLQRFDAAQQQYWKSIELQTITFSKDEVSFGSGSPRINSFASDFLNQDIRSGDLVVVTGSTETSDDGLFVITSVSASELILDYPLGFSFSGTLSNTSLVTVVKAAAPISELNFEEVSGTTGLMLIDIFATNEAEIFYSKRLEISSVLYSSGFYAAVIDVSKNFILSGEEYTLIVGTDGLAYLRDSDSNEGERLFVGVRTGTPATSSHSNIFKLRSPDGASFISIRVIATNPPSSELSCTIYGGSEVARNVLHLSRCLFSNATGRIFGTSGTGGIPSIIDKRNFGTIDIEQICPSFIEKHIEGPRGELRSAGIVSGCQVLNFTLDGSYVTFDVSPGVYYSNGIRKEVSGVIGYKTNKINNSFVCLNEYGELEVGEFTIGGPRYYGTSPFIYRSVAYLGYIDFDYVDEGFADLRFFINNLDGKVSKEIIVAKSTSLGHFTDIQSAIHYSELFYLIQYGKELFEYFNPTIFIREGSYTIESPIKIKQNITIMGSGDSTVIKRGVEISSPWTSSSGVPDPNTAIFIVQQGPAMGDVSGSYSNGLNNGVCIKSLRYISSTLPSGSSTAFCIYQGMPEDTQTPTGTLRLESISADGPTERDTDSSIREYFLFCGRPSNLSPGVEFSNIFLSISNIFISSCFLRRMGAYQSGTSGFEENIAVELPMQSGSSSADPKVKNIVITSNICIGVCPTAPSEASSILRTSTQGYSISGIIEASNVVRSDL